MRRLLAALRRLRGVRIAREAGAIAWMYQEYPWFADYAVFRSGRDWQAVHLASGTVLAPARTPQALHSLILADVQSRPVPVPAGAGPDDRTRFDLRRARPYAEGPPLGGGRL